MYGSDGLYPSPPMTLFADAAFGALDDWDDWDDCAPPPVKCDRYGFEWCECREIVCCGEGYVG